MEQYKKVLKQFDRRLNKTYKNKHEFKKCDLFCRKNYVKNINQVVKKNALRLDVPYKNPTKSDMTLVIMVARKCIVMNNVRDMKI